MVGENISHYKILEKLGEGGMGVVYKARDTNLDRDVALKFLPFDTTPKEKDKARFRQEARAAAQLNHPHICGIHAINEHEGQQFIEMEYIEGQTLRKKMDEAGRLSLENSRKYALQIAEALSAAHHEDIIHRDIKPENIMVDNQDRIKVMDFGLAKLKGVQHYTKTGSTVGTVTYMSPEQMQSLEIDTRSDLFSLGVVLYEMLTGTHPFKAEYEQALMFKILNEDPDPPSSIKDDIPAELENIVINCLQKDREKRYGAVDEIIMELQEGEKGSVRKTFEKVSTGNLNEAIPGSQTLSQKNLAWALPAGLLVLLVGFLWFYPSVLGFESSESIPEEKNIVVLPFKNSSPRDIPQSIADGIMEILTSKITQMEIYQTSFSVVPSSDVRANNITSVSEAANLFGINLAVTGSLNHVGNRLYLTINLVDANAMRQLRSSVIEMDWENHNGLQEAVVSDLTGMLEVELEPGTRQMLTVSGTQSSRVYQLYVEGRGYLSRFESEESLDKAIETFRQAIEADTGYVRAHAALAEAYWRKFELTRNTDWAKEAQKYGEKAINSMDDAVPEAYITMALIYNGRGQNRDALKMLNKLDGPESTSYQALTEQAKANVALGNIEKAEKLYNKAIEQKEKYWAGHNNLGKFYYNQGRLKEAEETFKKVTELAPDNILGYNNLAAVYFEMRKWEEAIKVFNKSLTVKPNHFALTNLGIVYYYQKNYTEAIKMFEKALELRQTDSRSWGPLGYAYHWSGKDTSKVKKYLSKAIELAEQELEISPNNPEVISRLAGYHAVLGNDKKCRDLLQKLTSLEDPDEYTRVSIIHLYELLGNREAALNWAEKSSEKGYSLQMLKMVGGVEDLLNEPRMEKLLDK